MNGNSRNCEDNLGTFIVIKDGELYSISLLKSLFQPVYGRTCVSQPRPKVGRSALGRVSISGHLSTAINSPVSYLRVAIAQG